MIEWPDDACRNNSAMICPISMKSIMAKESYDALMAILDEEYPASTFTFLFDKNLFGHQVIIFEEAADHLSFKLKYGALYFGEEQR